MATHLSAHLALPSDPEGAFALLTDQAYVEEVATATGGHDVAVSITTHEDGGATVVSAACCRPTSPRSRRRSWARTSSSPRPGSTARQRTTAPGRHLHRRLRHDADRDRRDPAPRRRGSASGLAIEIEIKASVPFVGGKVEGVASGWIEKFVAKEEKVAASYDV